MAARVPKVFGMEDVLTFGKYKGKQVKWVADNDYSYLFWAYTNVDWAKFGEDVTDLIDKKGLPKSPRRKSARYDYQDNGKYDGYGYPWEDMFGHDEFY